MAISGAAFASAMGRQGRWYSKFLAASGARLGTWLPNPKWVREVQAVDGKDPTVPRRMPWFRAASYFYRELFGINNSLARLVQVTDGGHYENLGLVEALRRRCRLIYCIDASGDPPPSLTTLNEAIRLAEFELGVTITLRNSDLRDVVPGTGTPSGVDGVEKQLAGRVARTPVIVGDITYPEAAGLGMGESRTGTLIFAKAVLTPECPGWVLRYAASSPVFPHDSTSDQWFGEAQFAAYTELGRVLGTAAMVEDSATALWARRHTARKRLRAGDYALAQDEPRTGMDGS